MIRKSFIILFVYLLFYFPANSQSVNQYEISFKNAVHHEAEVSVLFPNLSDKILKARMSRTSPGRYALHEFGKNVYHVKAYDSKGNELEIYRPDPYQWNITGHDGEVKLIYTLFAEQADGTYSAIDETHAHLNIPATFMYAKGLEHRPVEVTFNARKDLDWKVATQLKLLGDNKYYAPDLQYFMDSPVEISDFTLKEWEEESNGKKYTIRFALHHRDTEEAVNNYTDMVKAIVKEQQAVYGELPDFDYGTYTFLACYLPHVNGDGMEHRNSTILTSTRPLSTGAIRNIGTVSHEFFHAWNVERIRPASLEPFNFEEVNMSGELWFAEGFTSYYTNLILARAGIVSRDDYIIGLAGTLNYVINSPGQQYFSPVEMSYQAPFVDAATAVDPNNRGNTFISYYSYGSGLGLALDLELRTRFKEKSLDDFMRDVWKKFGKPEQPYTVGDLEEALAEYTGDEDFAALFFQRFITGKELPDYKSLLEKAGVKLAKANPGKVTLGSAIEIKEGCAVVASTVYVNSNLYDAGIEKGDILKSINGKAIYTQEELEAFLLLASPSQRIAIEYVQRGIAKNTHLELAEDKRLSTALIENPNKSQQAILNEWLKSGVK